jgi:hypothetical protein
MDRPPPVIADLLAICTRELGAEHTALLAASADAEAAASLDGIGEEYEDDAEEYETADPTRATLLAWSELWAGLARARPEAFLPNAKRLHKDRPLSLAFAYARRREPDALLPVSLTEAESEALAHGRKALLAVTGLAGLRRPCRAWTYTNDCLALRRHSALLGQVSAGAFAFSDPGLRRNTLIVGNIIERYRSDPAFNYLPVLLLHEEYRAALLAAADAAEPGKGATARPLVVGLQEPATVLGELYGEALLRHGTAPTRAELEHLSYEHPGGDRARALLRLCPPDLDAASVIALAVSVAALAAKTLTDEQLADELSALFPVRRTAGQWRQLFA